jgi:hypothetical protein
MPHAWPFFLLTFNYAGPWLLSTGRRAMAGCRRVARCGRRERHVPHIHMGLSTGCRVALAQVVAASSGCGSALFLVHYGLVQYDRSQCAVAQHPELATRHWIYQPMRGSPPRGDSGYAVSSTTGAHTWRRAVAATKRGATSRDKKRLLPALCVSSRALG